MTHVTFTGPNTALYVHPKGGVKERQQEGGVNEVGRAKEDGASEEDKEPNKKKSEKVCGPLGNEVT